MTFPAAVETPLPAPTEGGLKYFIAHYRIQANTSMMKKTILAGIAACVIIFSLVKEGHVTKTYYKDVSLEHVVERADYILWVEKEKPFSTRREIRIEKDGTLYHRFALMQLHFKVLKVIYDRSRHNEPVAGASIIVNPAYSGESIRLNTLYYLEGIGKSPVHDRYRSSIAFDSVNEMIIFVIRNNDDTFEFCCEYGHESVNREKEILQMFEKANN